jgi:hypothetical protein
MEVWNTLLIYECFEIKQHCIYESTIKTKVKEKIKIWKKSTS